MKIKKINTNQLTENQVKVFDALLKSKEPLSAYKILDKLRNKGLRAPLQIYRALDKLIEYGMVHRLKSLNSFVVCQQETCDGKKDKETIIFIICDICSSVKEMINQRFVNSVKNIAENDNFFLRETIVELHGKCSNCQSK